MQYTTRWVLDGTILTAVASLIILVSLRLNPRIWLQDYPAEIQAAVPPKTPQEKKLSLTLGIPFLLLLLGAPLVSTLLLEQQAAAPLPFPLLFVNAFGVLFLFNLFDWLVLDWLLFCTITPHFLVIPGTETMPAYRNCGYHFRGFLAGAAISGVWGLVAAAAVSFL